MLEALSRGAFDRELALLDDRLIARRGWTVLTAQFPVLDVVFNHHSRVPVRLRFTCDGWDDQPPAIEILTADGQHIPSTREPGSPYEYVFTGSMSIFNSGPHEQHTRPFICMRGSRDYHNHSGHSADHWDNYRGQSGNGLLGLLEQLWRVWKRAADQ
ncbi:putative metal-binding protein [Ancylobacter sp. FA202]|uniref:putative metal-binding protein n=1 Tax=Ancylobacter sp. FA202 TaxID=1111106 RepID=UPI000477F8DA|nr:putative metal-binding protein [Ancylobacter sp. FA202]